MEKSKDDRYYNAAEMRALAEQAERDAKADKVAVGDVWRAHYQTGEAWPFSDHVVTQIVGSLAKVARPHAIATESGGFYTGNEVYTIETKRLLDPQFNWKRVDTKRIT